jgi:hypothetical protein
VSENCKQENALDWALAAMNRPRSIWRASMRVRAVLRVEGNLKRACRSKPMLRNGMAVAMYHGNPFGQVGVMRIYCAACCPMRATSPLQCENRIEHRGVGLNSVCVADCTPKTHTFLVPLSQLLAWLWIRTASASNCPSGQRRRDLRRSNLARSVASSFSKIQLAMTEQWP